MDNKLIFINNHTFYTNRFYASEYYSTVYFDLFDDNNRLSHLIEFTSSNAKDCFKLNQKIVNRMNEDHAIYIYLLKDYIYGDW